jgi:uncharacterized protein YdhG (YjbR/CyaY superfamily)
VPTNSDRSSYFPAIERKHGQPMSFWFDVVAGIADRKYAEQIAYLRENHGFSQAHANALVLYSRGNTSWRRFDTFDGYLDEHDQVKQATVRRIFDVLLRARPGSEVVIAWNHPMLKQGGKYLFGVSVHADHITIAPFSDGILELMRPRLTGFTVNKKTIRVPVDWEVDETLIADMVAADLE